MIAWPTRSPDELRRLRSLTIWDIAVQTESRARLSFALCQSLDDAEIRSAIMLNAWEESSHKEVLSHMVRAYGIELAEETPYRRREIGIGFSCHGLDRIDRQFLPSAFSSGQAIGFLPQSSSRRSNGHPGGSPHICSSQLAGVAPRQPPLVARIRFECVSRRPGLHRRSAHRACGRWAPNTKVSHQDSNFTVTGAQAVTSTKIGSSTHASCLQENDRRWPATTRGVPATRIPSLARFVLAVGKLWPSQRR